jgi:hypothetical protein
MHISAMKHSAADIKMHRLRQAAHMTGAPGWTREVSGPMVTVLDRRT